MSRALSRFVENSQKAYIPEVSLTVDEQLFPTEARCRFTQFMPNKPDKFGIKFWILAELNPYLGKDDQRVAALETHIVLTLMEPYFGRGYNVTVDNFFTSVELAKKLLEKRTSLVGTYYSATEQKRNTSLFQVGYPRLSVLQLRLTEPCQISGQANKNCCGSVNTTQRCRMPNKRKEKARVNSILQ